MRYGEIYDPVTKIALVQIEKRTAKRYFLKGVGIYLMPSNRPFSVFCDSTPIKLSEYNNDFEKLCNAFSYYNCNRGTYIQFFINKEEL